MELMQLEMFVAVFEERSVRRAAERVCRTQPAVSLALGKLEWTVGSRLMERRRGDYRLTDAGKLLYQYASQIIALRNEALSQLGATNTTCKGRLCVGAGLSEPLPWLSQLACAFGKKYPCVRLEVFYDHPEGLVDDLVKRRIDMAFLPAPLKPNGANSNLVTLAMFVPGGGSGQVEPVWVVQDRDGCSYMAKSFETMAISLSRGSTRASHLQESPTKVRVKNPNQGTSSSALKTAAVSSRQPRRATLGLCTSVGD
jgi:hypothetical protein